MDVIGQFYERAGFLVGQQAPDDVAVPLATAGAIGCVISGLMISVLGAKLARFSLTLGFGVMGIVAGVFLGERVNLPTAAVAMGVAVGTGLIGFFMHRVWVGVLTGALMVLAVNSTYGVHTVAPHLPVFEQDFGNMPAAVVQKLSTADLGARNIQINPEFTQWIKGFWDYTKLHEKRGVRHVALLSGCAGLFGMLLGLFAVRFTLVLVTSIVGTLLITGGAIGMAEQWQPQLYQAMIEHPQVLGMAGGTCLLGSIILQTLLTRPDKSAKPQQAKS